MSTHIKGFIPDTDPTYQKHKKVLIACYEAGIKKLPQETAIYFGNEYPDPYLLEEKLEVDILFNKLDDDSSNHYEVFIKDIPEGVEKIRFSNSW